MQNNVWKIFFGSRKDNFIQDGLPLFVYDYKPTLPNQSSIMAKVGRGKLVFNENDEITNIKEITEETNSLNENDVIFLSQFEYIFDPNEQNSTGLVLSDISDSEGNVIANAGDFIYEGETQSDKLLNVNKCYYFRLKTVNYMFNC